MTPDTKNSKKSGMMAVADAVREVTSGLTALPPETLALSDCLGRVLAQDIASRTTHPPAAVSSMDGYALRAADAATPGTKLKVIGESAAGKGFEQPIGAGECTRIFTGAPLPQGADSVLIQEDADRDGDQVSFSVAAERGRWVRPQGLDFSEGDVLLSRGQVLGARDLGLAAAMNRPWLPVTRKPRVAILSTGNELVMPGEPLGPDQIVNSNSVALQGYVTVLGGEPTLLGIARDEESQVEQLLAAAQGCDFLITTGGASVGDHDLISQIMERPDMDLHFRKVAMRPGKPVIFGHVGGVPMMGFPGNPVSTGVSAFVYLSAILGTLLGMSKPGPLSSRAKLGSDLDENDTRQDYLRATLARDDTGDLVATPFDRQDSSMQAAFARADCLIVRKPYAPALKAGDSVDIMTLRGGLSGF